ncbi:o-succinylbenzoate synthase [Brenneria goodwinii]|uniref:o-succinylbenzoate synthase n=1 Tax=Brenneria goodwinii TaxID=1109412 RepID=UPI000EF191D3|nr:o-succinylbenzoate synthase [Brenneria goodwinii]MCG8159104.1 o-succinylbenzoate synthase [Brenneria goodwinii]MCG8161561.1 o-succinylbenzoate synthase [Brenneria goodwinii]MCG8165550.1 o-succinylbenzoate synthase [Brenneria goodwinii]MCG8170038.1 o-succinylbenzoate synthase [Brenneria goodwinii]MCG8174247.1 o-succinylbenzoate synthase [Brenneria goodwinii]
MRQVKVYRYSVPMEAGVVLRNQRLKSRDGLIVLLQQDGGQGWGEIAPLPEFSAETLAEAESATLAQLRRWVAGEAPADDLPPSVAFGLSCAQAELEQRLPEAADYRKAPLCNGDPDELFAMLQGLPGEKVAKVKVGLYEAVRDGMIVNVLLEALPDLKLRLDANRSWTRAKADGFARYVAPALRSRIAFLEEPCKTRQESREFARETGINIAWDESVREADFQVEAEPGVSAIVIKPTLVGSLDRCQQLIQQAHQVGLTAVISSSIESSLGLTQLARLAHWLTPDTIPGLDTLDLMRAQVVRSWPESGLPLLTAEQLELVWQC